jgi:hypothetical protein
LIDSGRRQNADVDRDSSIRDRKGGSGDSDQSLGIQLEVFRNRRQALLDSSLGSKHINQHRLLISNADENTRNHEHVSVKAVD